MKSINIKLFTLLFILGISTIVFSQADRGTSRVGTTAGQFLKIGAGARAIGMGEAYAAIPGDIYSAYWNPAGLAAGNSAMQFGFNHADWLVDTDYDFAAGSFNLGNMGTVFATFTNFSVPEDKVRTLGNPDGDGRTWDASMLALGVGYSKMITERFSFGFQMKYLQETIWNSTASGFAFDFGTMYRTPFNDLMIGAVISNFGSSMSLDGRDIAFNYDPDNDENSGANNVPANYEMESFDLPLTFRLGISMNAIETRYIRATVAIDAVHPNDQTEFVNSGLELAYDEMFFVRVGYKSLWKEDSEEGLTLGGGIKYEIQPNMKLSINYGYGDYGRLEDIQFFDVGIEL